MLFSWKET